jgi:hypothetical protein
MRDARTVELRPDALRNHVHVVILEVLGNPRHERNPDRSKKKHKNTTKAKNFLVMLNVDIFISIISILVI